MGSRSKLFVGNLKTKDLQASPVGPDNPAAILMKNNLTQLFSSYGTINQIWVAQKPPGFAFVTFSSDAEAANASDDLNGKEVESICEVNGIKFWFLIGGD